MIEDRINIKLLSKPELQDLMKDIGEKPFRSKQIFKWIFKGSSDFEEMTDLSETLRNKLAQKAYIGRLKVEDIQKSEDGTVKFLYRLDDGNCIETVFMKYKYGNSICVSSQAGCRMGCTFCASGKNGLSRNLYAGEIADQIIQTEIHTGEKIGHIVVMGTGEPFDNYDNVSEFIRRINDRDGLGIGMRNITVSTSGIIPVIDRFGRDFPQAGLAVSLHAPTDELRNRTMPVNRKYPVEELIRECRKYTEDTGRRITFEYAVINGFNDTDHYIGLLEKLLKGMLCHVNLIPLNEIEDGQDLEGKDLRAGSRKRAGEIAEHLEKHGIPATVRRSLGRDIDAACGQLRLKKSIV